MLNKTKLTSMLLLQDEMNKKVNPQWLEAKYPWLRAVVIEAAEAIEHHGWKWWKRQDRDLPQMQMELVDIWHFYLSHYMQRADGHIESAAMMILGQLGSQHFEGFFLDSDYRRPAEMDFVRKAEMMIGLAVVGKVSVALFEMMLRDAEMSWDMLHRQYIGKNVLNFFRQDFGYKDGTYRKVWGDGREDNEHLAEILQEVQDATAVYIKLKYRYEVMA